MTHFHSSIVDPHLHAQKLDQNVPQIQKFHY